MNKILLNGVWDIESQNKMYVLKGDVPGTDFGNLIKQGLIQNPLISGIEKDALTIAENDFVFSREFEVDKATLEYSHIALRCANIDTLADIYINDFLVISLNNAYIPLDVDIKEQLSFKYKNGAVGTCKVDGTSKLSLTVKIQGDKGTMNIDMVNCPNIITTFNKCGIMTSCKFTKPKYGGFEYELYACKKALQEGKIECEEWSHKKSIAAAKIIDDIFNSENALK